MVGVIFNLVEVAADKVVETEESMEELDD